VKVLTLTFQSNQLIRDLDDVNIVDINNWFEEIVFKVNYTDNKSDIIEWISTCMDNYILSYVNSKIRLRTQIKMGSYTYA
jgi:hypothetical protein